MKSTLWFPVAVRLVGLLLLGLAAPSVFAMAGTVVWLLAKLPEFRRSIGEAGSGAPIVAGCIGMASVIFQVWLGWYLLFRGEGLIRYIVKDARDRCPKCSHSTRGLTGAACPECGCPLQPHAAPPSGDTLGPGAA